MPMGAVSTPSNEIIDRIENPTTLQLTRARRIAVLTLYGQRKLEPRTWQPKFSGWELVLVSSKRPPHMCSPALFAGESDLPKPRRAAVNLKAS